MMERRDFVRTLGAAALGQVLQPRAPSPYPRAPLHKLDRIGLQLYTVRHQMEKDLEGTIARVATTGYREVEFAGYFGMSAPSWTTTGSRRPRHTYRSLRTSGGRRSRLHPSSATAIS